MDDVELAAQGRIVSLSTAAVNAVRPGKRPIGPGMCFWFQNVYYEAVALMDGGTTVQAVERGR